MTLLVVSVFGTLKASDAYNLSLAQVRADDAVVAALGEPIEPSLIVSGNIHVSNQVGNADVHYDITGPKGTGAVHAVAFKEAGSWKFRSIVVKTSAGEKIDVLDRQRKLEQSNEAI